MLTEEQKAIRSVEYKEHQKKAEDLYTERQYPVSFHNDWIRGKRYPTTHAGNSLTIMEQKVFLYLVSKIDTREKELKPQILNLKHFCEVCGIGGATPSDRYSHVKKCVQQLRNRSAWIKLADGREALVGIVSKAYLNKRQGTMTVILDEDMTPYLLSLAGNFTKFPLIEVLRMKSKYGIDLYQILKSYVFQGKEETVEFTIEELKERLDCVSYSSTSNFKVRVIAPALKDINTYSSLQVREVYKKQGRTITSVVFYVKDLSKSRDRSDWTRYNERQCVAMHEFDENYQFSFFVEDQECLSDGVIDAEYEEFDEPASDSVFIGA